MIKFVCGNCKEFFRISEEKIITKKNIQCPNCDQKIDNKIIENLILYLSTIKTANSYFDKVKELSISKDFTGDSLGHKKLWEIVIEEI